MIVTSSTEEKARDSARERVLTNRDVPSGELTDIEDIVLLRIEP